MLNNIFCFRLMVVAAAFLLDFILGDPQWLLHPVRIIGAFISWFEKQLWGRLHLSKKKNEDKKLKRIAGRVLVGVTIFFSVLIPLLILIFVNNHFGLYGRFVVEIIMCYQLLAARSLVTESMKVHIAITNDMFDEDDCLDRGRKAVAMIVGRDTDKLDMDGVIRATVETIAENTSDGVVAPLFYMFLFGPLGGYFYKAVNTMDSMVGYKNDRYRYFGTAAAKLDDWLNFVPSRISGVLMVVAALFTGNDSKNAWKIYRRDRFNHASPNAAQTEAACAGALHLRLAGPTYYFGELHNKPYIGEDDRRITPKDISRANYLMYGTSFLMLLIGSGILFLFYMISI